MIKRTYLQSEEIGERLISERHAEQLERIRVWYESVILVYHAEHERGWSGWNHVQTRAVER